MSGVQAGGKGILLAGGSGTRLHPMTMAASKQLLPVYDKPMVYYALSILMLAGIRDILVISTPDDLPGFRRLLGTGARLGVRFTYAEQPRPEGIAQAFLIGETFLAGDSAALVLGDNIFFGHGMSGQLEDAVAALDSDGGCALFGYRVADPERYGVAVLGADGLLSTVPAEPIAADLRDDADGKRLARIKLYAGLIGVKLDDLVQRDFTAQRPNQLWVTDITEHPTTQGKRTAAPSKTCSATGSSATPWTSG